MFTTEEVRAVMRDTGMDELQARRHLESRIILRQRDARSRVLAQMARPDQPAGPQFALVQDGHIADADECRALVIRPGDTFELVQDKGGDWTHHRLKLLFVGRRAAMWSLSVRSAASPTWPEPVEADDSSLSAEFLWTDEPWVLVSRVRPEGS